MKSVLCMAAMTGVVTFANAGIPASPELSNQGRIKHGSKPSNMHLGRKIFTYWNEIPGAIEYELCH